MNNNEILQQHLEAIIEEVTTMTTFDECLDYINNTCLDFDIITEEITEGEQTNVGASILRTYGGPTIVIEVNNKGGYHYYTTVSVSFGGKQVTADIDALALENFIEAVAY